MVALVGGPPPTDPHWLTRGSEKFAKRLLGESDVEAILQRLDRLTQEEARMAGAHTLQVVHGLFDNLKVVMNGGLPFLVATKWLTILVRVDGKASMIAIQQALGMFSLRGTPNSPKLMAHVSFDSRDSGWNKQTAESVPMFTLPLLIVVEVEPDSQGTNSKCMSEVGSPLRIPRSITILPAKTISRALRHGSPKVTCIKNGQRQGHSFGFMVNVRVSPTSWSHSLITPGG